MGLMEKALGALGWQKKAAGVTFPMIGATSMGVAGTAGEVVSDRSAMGLSAVWACLNLITGTISSLPLGTYTTRPDGSREYDRSHPLFRILHDSPNFDQTALDFWDFISQSIELWGNGYAEKQRGPNGRLIGLYPIRPDLMRVQRLQDGSLFYTWSDNGRAKRGTEQDVFHIRGPGGDAVGGLSTLQYARNAFSAGLAADRAAGSMFRNELRPSGVVHFKEWLTPEQRASANKVVDGYLGTMNAGRPFIAEGGMDFKPLSITPEDAQMLETRQFNVEEICRFFGVPPVLIGHAGASTAWPSSVEQQVIMFLQFTLRRRLARIEQAIRQQLLTPAEVARGVVAEFAIEGLLRGDSTTRAAFYGAGLSSGWLTINEVRRRENLPRVDGGDTPRMQMQNVPIDNPGAQTEGE